MLTPRRPHTAGTTPRTRQRGAVLLLMVLILMIGGSWFGLRALNTARTSVSPDLAGLAEARDALIGASMAMQLSGITGPGRLPPPDFLDPAEVPANNYDGNTNLACARSTWGPGAALPVVGGTLAVDSRCFGRLPWASLGLGRYGAVPQSDPAGMVPWYAMSANLVTGCIPSLNPDILNTTYTPFPPGTCKTVAQPFPWLTVRDYRGNVLTTRAAFVLLLPGPPLGTQSRPANPLSGPAGYLDSVTVAAGCAQPCVPGTYNNARFNLANNIGLSFIQCAPPGTVKTGDTGFTQPYLCNDRLLYVTIDELMENAERRAMQYAAERLRAFYDRNFFFPWAAPHDPADPSGFGECRNGLTRGLIPHVTETNALDVNRCTHTAFDFNAANVAPAITFDAWFNGNKWGQFIYYAVAPDCTQTSPGSSAAADCGGATGIRLATGTAANARAVLVGAGARIGAPPFAASRGAAQARPSANIADYLDSTENTDGNNRFDPPALTLTRAYNDKSLVVAP